MTQLFSKAHYRKSRKSNMIAARQNRDALTNPEGFWKYAPDDERVKAATAKWVARARHAHAVAMGREPVIRNAVAFFYGDMSTGPVYAA